MTSGIENLVKLETEEFPEINFIDVVPEILTSSELTLLFDVTLLRQPYSHTFKPRLTNIPGHQYLARINSVTYKWWPIDRFPFTFVSREEMSTWGRFWHPKRGAGSISDTSEKIRNTFLGYYENESLKSGQFKVVLDSRTYCPGSPGNLELFSGLQMMDFLNSTVFQVKYFILNIFP